MTSYVRSTPSAHSGALALASPVATEVADAGDGDGRVASHAVAVIPTAIAAATIAVRRGAVIGSGAG